MKPSNASPLIAAIWMVTAVGASQRPPSPMVAMRGLTVPAESLPARCRLSPAPTADLDNGRVRLGLWAEFPSNPWIGDERRLLASIRQLVEGPVKIPDGPPLDSRELSRFEGQLADGVEEGYGAVYLDSDGGMVIVRAVKLAPLEKPFAGSLLPPLKESSSAIRIAIGQIVGIVTGEGECFQAVAAHLKSLAR